MNIVDLHKNKIFELCEKHEVKELYLFGSVLTEKFNESSDVDMLIQFNPIDLTKYFDNYMDLKEQLADILKRPVDLVENQAIKNPIFRKIVDREKKLLYERKSA
ncbi:MAG: hypothetical protein FD181_3462 [Prolixibacteraceae bacterium]|nr:MAG: hypothetical protein FD181_3462 [Prolixibacteraceae bacterium]